MLEGKEEDTLKIRARVMKTIVKVLKSAGSPGRMTGNH